MPKLRPIIGHLLQREMLEQDLEQGNVAHAYLFSGPRHLGKMTTAWWYASQLLSDGLANEEAASARKRIEKLTHPDLLVLDQLWMEDVCEDWDIIAKSSNVPQVHRSKKPPAKTDIISIDDIRALQERLTETGTGTYRCCLIRSVERMQDAAANAFLKILEEPPQGLVFLLTTQEQSQLLPTVVSRTRNMPFRRVPTKELRSMLSGIEEDDVQFMMHIARGAPGVVSLLRDDPDALRAHRLVHNQTQSFWHATSLRERLGLLAPLHERGQEADQFLLHLGLTLREQGATASPAHVCALSTLGRGLMTNAHRQLLTQQFALAVN